MRQNTLKCREAQEQRLKIKTLSQQMKNLARVGFLKSPLISSFNFPFQFVVFNRRLF